MQKDNNTADETNILERRASDRHPASVEATLVMNSGTDMKKCNIINFSLGGMLLAIDPSIFASLQPGSHIAIELSLEHDQMLKRYSDRATVIYLRDEYVAVSYENYDCIHSNILQNLFHRLYLQNTRADQSTQAGDHQRVYKPFRQINRPFHH